MSVCATCGRGGGPSPVSVKMPATRKRVRKSPPKPDGVLVKVGNLPETPIAALIAEPVPDDSGSTETLKRGRGRPLGCRDAVKRKPKGSLNKPPVKHGALGRPKGVKDSKPRQRKVIVVDSPMPV